jgi:predicted RecB family endonuclease
VTIFHTPRVHCSFGDIDNPFTQDYDYPTYEEISGVTEKGRLTMDINEQIVRSWLETQGFLVKSRLRYKITKGKYTGWGDIDLIAIRLHDGKRVAIDITAWMTEYISLSYVTDPKSGSYYRLFKSSFPEARAAVRQELGVHNDKQYEIWLVVSYLAPTQKEQVRAECLKHVDRVIEFPQIMKELVDYIRSNSKPSQETEALQTIRALVLSEIL